MKDSLHLNVLYSFAYKSILTCYDIEAVKDNIEPSVDPLEKDGARQAPNLRHDSDHDKRLYLVEVNEKPGDVMQRLFINTNLLTIVLVFSVFLKHDHY